LRVDEWKVASGYLYGATLWHHPITYVPSQDGIDNPTVKQLTNDDAFGTLKLIFLKVTNPVKNLPAGCSTSDEHKNQIKRQEATDSYKKLSEFIS
jgi:hypothetical protein